MFDKKRPFWKSSALHLILIGGSVAFALPYFWLVGTSWKLDKEVQSEEITILPQRPIPTPVSPYIDTRQFSEIEKPEEVGRHAWAHWMQDALNDELGKAVDDWIKTTDENRVKQVPEDVLRDTLVRGAFDQLEDLLPYQLWNAEEQTFREGVRKALKPEYINDAFKQSFRQFALGKVLIKDKNFKIYDLTQQTPIADLWTIENGPVEIEARTEAGRPIGVMHYDFIKGESFEVSTMLDMPVAWKDFKKLAVSFCRDQTWHDLRIFVEVEGKRLKSDAPKYLGEDTWWEINLQEPGPDDAKMTAREYIHLVPDGEGSQYDHGEGKMKLCVQLHKSTVPEAYWAKGTENYRKAFEQVPFWHYFKTSVFLVIANIVGTAFSCTLVAFAFARLTWPGRELSFVLVLATLMIPPQVTMIPSFVIYKYLGWYNTLMPLWVPNCLAVNAFAVFLLRQSMKGIPRDLEDAAKIDGCGWFRIYWTIALPLMKPTIAAISIFTFMFVWNDFMTPLIYVNDQRLYPLALGLFSFLAGRENQFTLIMAGSMIMTIPVIITFFLAQRTFIQGVTMTGMKN